MSGIGQTSCFLVQPSLLASCAEEMIPSVGSEVGMPYEVCPCSGWSAYLVGCYTLENEFVWKFYLALSK